MSNTKKIIGVALVALTVAIAVNYYTGTSIVINGKPVNGIGGCSGGLCSTPSRGIVEREKPR
jgi:hypothetical protein